MTAPPGGPAGGDADTGLAHERTALAWQRTALSLVAAAAIMARLTWGSLGLVALLPLGAALVLSGWVFVESRKRYAHHAGTRPRVRPRSGRAPAALAVATALIAGTELLALAAAR